MSIIQYDRNRTFRVWDISQIWKGPDNDESGAIAPNPRDMVVDPAIGIYIVLSVDGTVTIDNPLPSYLSVLQLVLPFTQVDGQITHQATVLDRVYLNTRVRPYTLTVDPSYKVLGSDAAFMKYFRGTDTSALSGEVVSAVYSGQTLTSENVALERINPNNDAEKRPVTCNSTRNMGDKELITAVIYNHQGGAIGERIFVVKNSNAMRGLGQSTSYIVDVVLVSSMLDPNLLDTVNVPARVPIAGGDFKARLIYNNGDTSDIAIGTPKCRLSGLDNFNTSLAGTPGNIVLTYFPDESEAVINASNPGINNLSHMYKVRTVNNTLDASYRVYVIPKYNANQTRYTNEYWLTDLTYNVFVKLSGPHFSVLPLGQTPLDYNQDGVSQVFVLSCKPALFVDSAPADYIFTQAFTIRYGLPTGFAWFIDYLNDNANVLGLNVYIEYSAANIISLRSGCTTVNSWLTRLWYPLHAIYDDTQFTFAPIPTHYKLMYGAEIGPVRDIASTWNNNLPKDFTADFVNYATVSIIWLKSTSVPDEYLTLGVTPMRLQNTL